MELTDAERAEFIALSEATYDAALWDEADLPFLRQAKRESPVEPLHPDATRIEPAAPCPQVPRGFPLSESEKQNHAESMTDGEFTNSQKPSREEDRPVGLDR